MSNLRRSCVVLPLLLVLVAACGSSSDDDAPAPRTLTAGSHKCTQASGKVSCPDPAPADKCKTGETAGWDLGINQRTGGQGVVWAVCVACSAPDGEGGTTAQEYDCVSITCDSDATCPTEGHCKDGFCQ